MLKQKNNFSKAVLGISLIVLGLILVSGKKSFLPTNFVSQSFAQEPVEVTGFINFDVSDDKIAKRIIIPSISVDLPVEKAEIKAGYWQVFEDSAGWGEGSGLPGETGNQVIFAHAKEGQFLPLKELRQGGFVYLLTDEGWYAYKVVEIKEVYPHQTEVIEPTEDERLTLYTCSGYADQKRLIIIAKPI